SKVKRESRLPLENKFTELTGLPASDKYLLKAIEQQASKDKLLNDNYTATDFMSDEELLSLQNEIEQSEQEQYEKERTIPGTESESTIEDSTGNDKKPKVQSESRQNDTGETTEGRSITDTEQASTQDRKSSLITERIKPERRTPKNSPKKLNQIISDAVKGLKSTLIYGRSSRTRSLGTYNPS